MEKPPDENNNSKQNSGSKTQIVWRNIEIVSNDQYVTNTVILSLLFTTCGSVILLTNKIEKAKCFGMFFKFGCVELLIPENIGNLFEKALNDKIKQEKIENKILCTFEMKTGLPDSSWLFIPFDYKFFQNFWNRAIKIAENENLTRFCYQQHLNEIAWEYRVVESGENLSIKSKENLLVESKENVSPKAITIYRTQLLAAQEILKSALQSDNNFLENVSKVNCLIIGPRSRSLKKQTSDEIEIFRGQFHFGSDSGDSLNGRIDNFAYVNSPMLGNKSSDNPAQKFLSSLKLDILNQKIHVIFHDEAHWGIRTTEEKVDNEDFIVNFSQITSFLDEINQILKYPQYQNRKFVLICVSATLEVLSIAGVLKVDNHKKINWSKDKYFYPESYVSVEDLKSKGCFIHSSETPNNVIDEYISAFRNLKKEKKTKPTVADTILKDLSESKDPIIAVVRFDKGRQDSLKEIFAFSSSSSNFEIKHMIENLDKQFWINVDELKTFKKSLLLFVVENLRMGDRVPNNCMFWDVRCRYNPLIDNLATFTQDVGRLAGHNKTTKVKIFVSCNIDEFTTFDRLLRKGKPIPGHPENEKNFVKIYSPFVERKQLILFEAKPQIGKTGVMLAFIGLLGVCLKSTQEKKNSIIYNTDLLKKNSELMSLTNYWKSLANKDFNEFQKSFSGEQWEEYHHLLSTKRKIWKTDSKDTFTIILDILNDGQTIADCGCGKGSLFVNVCENQFNNIMVDAFDVGLPKNDTVKDGTNTCNFYKSTMDPANWDKQYDLVVYNLSFFENDITKHLKWGLNHLKPQGKLIISETINRIPEKFKDLVQESFGCTLSQANMDPFVVFVLKHNKNTIASHQHMIVLKD